MMKKSFFYVSAALTLLFSLNSCNKEAADPDAGIAVKKGSFFEIVANPVATRTENAGLETNWSANDGIIVFHAVSGSTNYVNDGKFTITAENLEANRFTGKNLSDLVAGTSYDWYMLYPYAEQIQTPANNSHGYTTVGSSASGTQTQNGNDNTAHLAGSHIPLWGKITGVNSTDMPKVSVHQACAFLEIEVENNSGGDLTVSQVSFTGTEPIVGTYYINFAGDSPIFTGSGDTYVSNEAKLTVANGSVIANEGKAKFYLAIKPFTASSGTLKVAVNGYEKELALTSAVSFNAGMIRRLAFNYDNEVEKDYVTLDWAVSGLTKAELDDIDGVTLNAGSDYAVQNAPYRVKFSESTHYAIIKTDSEIDVVEIDVKGFSAGSGSTLSQLTVYGSSNGTDWTSIESFDVPTGELSFSASGFSSSHRYVKIGYTKAKNNAGIGRISITKPSTAPRITAEPITDVPAQGITEGAWTYTVHNFDDDVEVSQTTGCVTEAVAGDGEILYTVSPNYTQSAKTGTIVLRSASNNEVTKTIEVSQKSSSLSVSPSGEIVIPATEESATFTITSPDFSWTATPTNADGYSFTVSPASGLASETAQTITVSSAVEAASTEQVLGTIQVYRNGNASDSQKKTITVKKGYVNTGNDHTVKWTASNNALGYTSTFLSGTINTGDFSWSYARTGSSHYAGWTNNCVQLGKDGAVENVTFRTSNIPGTIKSVYVECSSYNAAHHVSITVGGTTYLAETATAKWQTISAKGGTGTSSGEIVISFTEGSRALYIKSITVVYNN